MRTPRNARWILLALTIAGSAPDSRSQSASPEKLAHANTYASSIQRRDTQAPKRPVAENFLPADPLFTHSFDSGLPDATANIVIELPEGFRLDGRLYAPSHPIGGAVVMMHGCTGLWSNGEPGSIAQAAIEKWGDQLARNGYFALAVDSYTSRTPPGGDVLEFQKQCSGDPHGGFVDPYTTRAADMEAAATWLRYRLGPFATQPIAALGWSQGAESVLVQAAETGRDVDVSRFDGAHHDASPVASVAFYPGCGTLLGFVDGDIATSFWRPHRDIRINHGGADSLHGDCALRSDIAVDHYGSVANSGHWVDYAEYPGAHHSFDGASPDWPEDRCAPGSPPSDLCAARDADIASFEFLSTRMNAEH